MVDRELISTSCVTRPIKEKTKVEPDAGTVSRYVPSASVTVPVAVPFTTTFTPGKVVPSSADVTFPDTTRSCAHATLRCSTKQKPNSKNFLIHFGFVLIHKLHPDRVANDRQDVISKLPKAKAKRMTNLMVYSWKMCNVYWVTSIIANNEQGISNDEY